MKTAPSPRRWLQRCGCPWAVAALGAAALAAVWLRIDGLGYGLPHTFNSDEPHIINLAASFGSGSLKPYSFKYPTLWPTLLFLCYGVYFAVWSGLGMLRSVADFAGLFAWEPTGFYLIGRALSTLFGLLGLAVVWRTERELRADSGLPWAALLLAAAPIMIESSHAAKPDMAMFFFAAVAWYAAVRVFREGGRVWYWVCGGALGLGMSTQYTALASAVLLPLAHVLRRQASPFGDRENAKNAMPGAVLFEGMAAGALGFIAGSPYILLDFPRFWAAMRDFSALAGIREKSLGEIALMVHLNVWNFAGAGSIAGLAVVVGAAACWRRDRRLAILLLGPIAAYTASLSTHPDGSWMRYLLGCFPGIALLAGEGLAAAARLGRAATGLALVLALGPGIYICFRHNGEISLPDTRTLGTEWVEKNIPSGTVLLMDYPHACPRLVMAKEQASELEAKTKAEGSPRWRLYAAMERSHPGGGYRIYRIRRAATDLRSNPEHVRVSQAETATLDVSAGLGAALAARVSFVVVSSHGATPERSPDLKGFFDELERKGTLAVEFAPVPRRLRGPHLRIFRL
ncbi:MAG: glycosyltransferase family 39 protein [Elusimicrobia bacterium]|nr:glycosyltransferase family 39 protein [Elusimicrobiota bacterium]